MSRGRRLVETPLGVVHVATGSGSRGRPLVMLHMSPRSSRMYLPAMELLDRPTAAVDRPGFGASDPPDHAPTMTEYAMATVTVADAIGWDEFDVIGTHTGSVEAVEVATLAPERVATVALVAIPAYTPAEVADRRRGIAAARDPLDAGGDSVRTLWRRRTEIRTPPYDMDHLRDLFVDEVVSLPTVHWAYEAVLAYPMLERFRSLRRMVVFGPHDDLWELTARARASLPAGSVFVELPDHDFDLWERDPGLMAGLVNEHLPAMSDAPSAVEEPVEGPEGDC